MKKILTIFTTVVIAGVIIYGSGSLAALNLTGINTAEKYGIIQMGMGSNASFLAPIPISLNVNPVYLEKLPCEQTGLDCNLVILRAMAKS